MMQPRTNPGIKSVGVIGDSYIVPSWTDAQQATRGQVTYPPHAMVSARTYPTERDPRLVPRDSEHSVYHAFRDNVSNDNSMQAIGKSYPIYNEVRQLESSIRLAYMQLQKTIVNNAEFKELRQRENHVTRNNNSLLLKCVEVIQHSTKGPRDAAVQVTPPVNTEDSIASCVQYRLFAGEHRTEVQSAQGWRCDLPGSLASSLVQGKITPGDVWQKLFLALPDRAETVRAYDIVMDHPTLSMARIQGSSALSGRGWRQSEPETNNLHEWREEILDENGTIRYKVVLTVGGLNLNVFKDWWNPRTALSIQQTILAAATASLGKGGQHTSVILPVQLSIEHSEDAVLQYTHAFTIMPFSAPERCMASVLHYTQSDLNAPNVGILKLPDDKTEIQGADQVECSDAHPFVALAGYRGRALDNRQIMSMHAIHVSATPDIPLDVVDKTWDSRVKQGNPHIKVARIKALPWDMVVSSHYMEEAREVHTFITVVHYPPFGTQFYSENLEYAKLLGLSDDGASSTSYSHSHRGDHWHSQQGGAGHNTPPRPPPETFYTFKRKKYAPVFIRGTGLSTTQDDDVLWFFPTHDDGGEEVAQVILQQIQLFTRDILHLAQERDNVRIYEYFSTQAEKGNHVPWDTWRQRCKGLVTDYLEFLGRGAPSRGVWYWAGNHAHFPMLNGKDKQSTELREYAQGVLESGIITGAMWVYIQDKTGDQFGTDDPECVPVDYRKFYYDKDAGDDTAGADYEGAPNDDGYQYDSGGQGGPDASDDTRGADDTGPPDGDGDQYDSGSQAHPFAGGYYQKLPEGQPKEERTYTHGGSLQSTTKVSDDSFKIAWYIAEVSGPRTHMKEPHWLVIRGLGPDMRSASWVYVFADSNLEGVDFWHAMVKNREIAENKFKKRCKGSVYAALDKAIPLVNTDLNSRKLWEDWNAIWVSCITTVLRQSNQGNMPGVIYAQGDPTTYPFMQDPEIHAYANRVHQNDWMQTWMDDTLKKNSDPKNPDSHAFTHPSPKSTTHQLTSRPVRGGQLRMPLRMQRAPPRSKDPQMAALEQKMKALESRLLDVRRVENNDHLLKMSLAGRSR